MRYEVAQDKEFPAANEWRVEAIDSKTGDIFIALFGGADAENRAREYAHWRESRETQRSVAS